MDFEISKRNLRTEKCNGRKNTAYILAAEEKLKS